MYLASRRLSGLCFCVRGKGEASQQETVTRGGITWHMHTALYHTKPSPPHPQPPSPLTMLIYQTGYSWLVVA
jgi:hypothetical protein